jgi:hypothetical protein
MAKPEILMDYERIAEASPLASTVFEYCRELHRRVQPTSLDRNPNFFEVIDLVDQIHIDPDQSGYE